jgi:threonine dehydrogenase-like Zn-dependent dehydrogenase
MELRDIPAPVPKPGEYRIRVKANGICGSDVEGYLGRTGRRTPPMIMGHEAAGIIEEAPAGGKYSKGQRVAVFPKPFCGVCDYCKAGLVNVCPEGICMGVMDVNGSMAEYIALEEKYLLPFSRDLSFNEASMTEPLAVAYRSAYKISQE